MHEESRKDQNKNKKELLDYVGKSRNEFREHTHTPLTPEHSIFDYGDKEITLYAHQKKKT